MSDHLNNYLSNSIKLNKDRVQHSIDIGRSGEALFKSLTNARKTEIDLDKQHIDFFWEGKLVDVKGLKRCHKEGYLLIEFIGGYGTTGWCSKNSKAEYIAFQFPERFYVFEKDLLRERTISLCPKYEGEDSVLRKNRVPIEEGVHKWLGRWNRKDVFTYITFEDVKDIVYDTVEIPRDRP